MNTDDTETYLPGNEEERDLLQGLIAFHSNEADALHSRFTNVESLLSVGHHSSSEGDFCEDLVRQFLRQVVPARYSIDHGFIRHTPRRRSTLPSCVSKQMDVIIHDSHNYAPLFRSGEFVIVLPQAVVGVIEVKKTLDTSKLDEALDNLAHANAILSHARKTLEGIFCGIFAFREGTDMQVTTKPYSDSYRTRILQACQNHNSLVAVPDAILVVQRHLFYRESHRSLPNDLYFRLLRRPVMTQEGHDVSIQAFLNVLYAKIGLPEMNDPSGRFIFPAELAEEKVAVFSGTEQVVP
jgi:hypothetical protein